VTDAPRTISRAASIGPFIVEEMVGKCRSKESAIGTLAVAAASGLVPFPDDGEHSAMLKVLDEMFPADKEPARSVAERVYKRMLSAVRTGKKRGRK